MTDFLLLGFVFLCAGVIAVPLATRFGLGSVLGYLIAGIAISPLLRLLGVDIISIQHFAEFGVVMMLFLVGLELEPKKLWSMRTKLLGLGGGQVLLTTAAITAVCMFFGLAWTIALAVGLVLALSSTAIVLQTLNEKGLMKSDGGQSSFSVLLLQDIAVIPMLALIPLLAMPELMDTMAGVESHGSTQSTGHSDGQAEKQGGGHDADHKGEHGGGHGPALSLVAGLAAWQAALVTIGAVAAVILGGMLLTGPLFRFIAAAKLRELFTAAALLMVIGIALLMTVVGLSPALGTFLAGVVLANSEYRHELESSIEPFKGLLLGLFFITVGAGVNFVLLLDQWALIIGMTFGLVALKATILYFLAVVFRVGGTDRFLFALGLAQAGEFGFVLLSLTVASQAIPTALADQLLLVVALSMLLTPLLFILWERVISPRFAIGETREADQIHEENRIIIAGHGRVGSIVNRILSGIGEKATVIDFSSEHLEVLKTFGIHSYFGDATRPDLLNAAGISKAKIFVIAIDEREQITELVSYVSRNYPDVHLIARAVDRNHVYDLYAAGCRDIIRDVFDSSTRMGRSALEALGIERERADRMIEQHRIMDARAMLAVAEVYDPALPIMENTAYIDKVKELRADWEKELAEKMQAIMNEKPKAS